MQTWQVPKGLLKEKSCGDGSVNTTCGWSGQRNRSVKSKRRSSVSITATTMASPSPSTKQVPRESASRSLRLGCTLRRSTTTRSSDAPLRSTSNPFTSPASGPDRSSATPSATSRRKPIARRFETIASCVTSLLRGSGKQTWMRVPSGRERTWSTPSLTVSGRTRRSHSGQCVCPTRDQSNRR